jgi:hypothetical protein
VAAHDEPQRLARWSSRFGPPLAPNYARAAVGHLQEICNRWMHPSRRYTLSARSASPSDNAVCSTCADYQVRQQSTAILEIVACPLSPGQLGTPPGQGNTTNPPFHSTAGAITTSNGWRERRTVCLSGLGRKWATARDRFGSWAEDPAAAEHGSFTTRCGLRSGVASWHFDEFAI